MKRLIILAALFALMKSNLAQSTSDDLKIILSLKSKDSRQTIDLIQNFDNENPIEGYFYQTEHEEFLFGNVIKGGFNFLDPEIFGGMVNFKPVREKWVDNKFPIQDLEVLTNGFEADKIFSFSIYPQIRNKTDNSISIFFKYGVFNSIRSSQDYQMDYDFNVKLRYKLLSFPLNKQVEIHFAENVVDSATLSIMCVEKERQNNFELPSDVLIKENIIQSLNESVIKEKINFSLEFVQDRIDKKETAYMTDFRKRIIQKYIPADILQYNDNKSSTPIYQSILKFPFTIYNKEKNAAYSSYKTRDSIFQSRYNLTIVPISYEKEDLIADIFITYSKLNIDDIPRWTPIKKRVKISKFNGNEFGLGGLKIDLPKENWSAAFSRKGEKYEIYGKPDFEDFVNEYIIITISNGDQL